MSQAPRRNRTLGPWAAGAALAVGARDALPRILLARSRGPSAKTLPAPPPPRLSRKQSELAVSASEFIYLHSVSCARCLNQQAVERVPSVSLTSNSAESRASLFFSWVWPANDFTQFWALSETQAFHSRRCD